MAFKHIRYTFTNTNVVSLFTVPAGKEFILLKKRARGLHSSGTATIVFKDNSNATIESLSVPQGNVVIGSSEKMLFSAGQQVKAQGVANAVAEIMGIEYVAGTWASRMSVMASGGTGSFADMNGKWKNSGGTLNNEPIYNNGIYYLQYYYGAMAGRWLWVVTKNAPLSSPSGAVETMSNSWMMYTNGTVTNTPVGAVFSANTMYYSGTCPTFA